MSNTASDDTYTRCEGVTALTFHYKMNATESAISFRKKKIEKIHVSFRKRSEYHVRKENEFNQGNSRFYFTKNSFKLFQRIFLSDKYTTMNEIRR